MNAPRARCADTSALTLRRMGFPHQRQELRDWALPFSSYPIQLSVDIVEEGEVRHAFDTVICGATSLAPWDEGTCTDHSGADPA